MKDKFGIDLKIGDIVHDDYGYDLVVFYDKKHGWYGMLTDVNSSCKDIPYTLTSNEIEKVYNK